MKIIVTGATGFVGSYLIPFLAKRGDEVWGTYYAGDKNKKMELGNNAKLVECDIRNAKMVHSLVAHVKPDRIYHLAAQSFPTVSWEEPALTFETNAIGTVNLFESVLRQELKPKILVACSSAEYGFVSEEEVPVSEDHPLRPLHPYGISKVAQDLLAYQYFINFGIPTVRVRIFNTTGPGKAGDVCSDFAKRIASVERGRSLQVLKVGNLQSRRDITDVRDAVTGLHLALEKGDPGEVYNLCSGTAYPVSELLNVLLRFARQKIEIEVDPNLLRPTDEPIIMGANHKIVRKTGWQLTIPIQKTLEDILDYWRTEDF